MQRFDCLASEAPLFGPHFLEASAGTGKTFAIEHIVARLILKGVDLEQILVVTFTRAAARELKLRIRTNLEKILAGAPWAYLSSDTKRIREALACFDRCQIFTIHGFCSRMLKECAFEAGLPLDFTESKEPAVEVALRDFFELQLTAAIVSPSQLKKVMQWAGSVEDLARKLKKEESTAEAKTFLQREAECKAALQQWPESLDSLSEEFAAIQANYRKMEGNFAAQIAALQEFDFASLIAEKESIFSFTAPENKKVKAKDALCPSFFDWGRQHLLPLIEAAQSPKQILADMLAVWKPMQKRVLKEAGALGPDELLSEMVMAITNDSFRQKVQRKYRAVLIDEFQDTDPMQWQIFETLFLHTAEALYLIGDPKQSIYRFRKADLYTYLKAKEAIPSEGHFYLDTNFRSSKPLIDALNGLFDRQWLYLPQQKRSLPYLPVLAGLDLITDFDDGKGSVHCVCLEKEQIFAYIARELLHLRDKVTSWSCFAVLVRSRYEAADMQKTLEQINIPSIARSQEPLTEGLAFEAIGELFEALQQPRHLGKAKTVLAGPFGGYSAEQLQTVEASPFGPLRQILEEKGLALFCQAFLHTHLGVFTVEESIAACGTSFQDEWTQLLEILFEWERQEGFTFEGVKRFLERLEKMDPDEAISRRKAVDTEAVQIMTMHVSKGLEFDIVFALGAGSRTPEGDEEVESEKLRQLYVAMTRAKRRLYLPIPIESKVAKPGTLSPIELFCQSLSREQSWEAELNRLSTLTSLTIEKITDPILLQPSLAITAEKISPSVYHLPPYKPSYVLSFTSLAPEMAKESLEPMAEPNGVYTAKNLPRGTETGVIVHRIFERIFSEETTLEEIVEQELGRLMLWKEAVIQMVQDTLNLPLAFGFCLREIDWKKARAEAEFLFLAEPNYIKGFIDLLFVHQEKLYFVDWKTNWLTEYSTEKLEIAIQAHSYDLQASIYSEALRRHWGGRLGGAIYLFVRGPQAICFDGGRPWN